MLPIKEMDVRDNDEMREKHIQDLFSIPFDRNDPKKVTYIMASLASLLKERLIKFLQDNKNVFVWTTTDMSEINYELITHKLNVSPDKAPMK